MSKRFLSREIIVKEALRMIDESGTDSFSVRQLAGNLGVQVSSLYNHIDNEYDLLLEVARCAADMYNETIEKSVIGLPLEEAAFKSGDVFRAFLNEHKYLYELLLDSRWIGDPKFEKVTERFTQPVYHLIPHNIREQKVLDHLYVAMRVITHGFATLDLIGVFDGLSVDAMDSYHIMIQSVLDTMKQLSEKEQE